MAKQTRAKRKTNSATQKSAAAQQTQAKSPATHIEVEVADRAPLQPAWKIGRQALLTMWRHRGFFLVLGLIYLLLDLLLVRSVAAFDVASLKSGLSSSFSQGAGWAVGGLSVFSSLFSAAASGASADATGAYHFFLAVLMSLVVIWSLRQVFTADNVEQALSIKAAFYRSTTPLVPFLLIILLIGLQFVPLLIVMQIYNFIVGGGIANNVAEQLIFLVILLAAAVLTLFWLTRSLIALYIVTLPGVQPMQALRSAKDLVRGRRLSLIRKVAFLPFVLFVVAAIIMVPCIIIWAPLAQWLFFALTGVGFIAVHAYLYSLYRELLDD